MNPKTITLAYCVDNLNIAREIEKELAPSHYRFETLSCDSFQKTDTTSHELLEQKRPVLLIISENFLKSTDCMSGALKMLQSLSRQNKLLPIIADGQHWDEVSQSMLSKRTVFEKASHVIQYMNYWQKQYLEIRRQKRHIQAAEEADFNKKLKIIRGVSSEVGEFLRHLRELNYLYYEDFERTHFQALFRFTADSSAFSTFKNDRIKTKTAQQKELVVESTDKMIAAFQKGSQQLKQEGQEEDSLIDEVISEIRQTNALTQESIPTDLLQNSPTTRNEEINLLEDIDTPQSNGNGFNGESKVQKESGRTK